MQGLIIKQISNDYSVLIDNKIYICKPRGKFRNMNISPLVGDYVEIDKENNYILDIKKRKNCLIRPTIANIDQAIIITSLKAPDFSSDLLDKLLVITHFHNVKPIIIFTKVDLCNEKELEKLSPYLDYYEKLYEVYFNSEIEKIKKIFKNKVSVFTGQSGAGKSTLLNSLNKEFNIKTAPISKALNRGKHTTRHTELLNLENGLVADTPGFSSIDLSVIPKEEIKNAFIEFDNYTCMYKNCMHDKEKECNIKNHIGKEIIQSRYDNYIKFINEKSNKN